MLPSKGFQSLLSFGAYFKYKNLTIQLKPEYLFSENLNFEGFSLNHYPEIWLKRYAGWNLYDIPERFGKNKISYLLLGQSKIELEFKKLLISFSNENIWWGPSLKNSIMMSNNARSFPHFSIKTKNKLKNKFFSTEFQFVTGKLIGSGFTPPNTDYEYGGRKLYIPKRNEITDPYDWRFFQGYILTLSPNFVKGLSIGFIRWVQMYGALIEGKYDWMSNKPNFLPVFSNLLRKNDKFDDVEQETDQAAGFFFRWIWHDSNAEIYGEFHYNDAKYNLRDLLLDSDHASAFTLGIQKIFKLNNDYKTKFFWEWTRMEQTASRLLRNAGSWYMHSKIRHGYTNFGEVLGSRIGPGSNSHFLSVSLIDDYDSYLLGLEIIEQDNDFYYYAFESASDFRRYWKDFNIHLEYTKKIKNIFLNANLMYSRSLNYQWNLNDNVEPWYHSGFDKNNLSLSLKLFYNFLD